MPTSDGKENFDLTAKLNPYLNVVLERNLSNPKSPSKGFLLDLMIWTFSTRPLTQLIFAFFSDGESDFTKSPISDEDGKYHV